MTQHINLPNCIVAQSGGPTVAINASLVGVICASIGHYGTVYGSINGILGILNQHYLNLTELAVSGKDTLQRLATTPAMYLGSCRYKLKDYHEDASDYKKIFAQFKALNIKAFFYIGGNDSMDTVLKLSSYADSIGSNIQIIGIPKTIDNDLMITDLQALALLQNTSHLHSLRLRMTRLFIQLKALRLSRLWDATPAG